MVNNVYPERLFSYCPFCLKQITFEKTHRRKVIKVHPFLPSVDPDQFDQQFVNVTSRSGLFYNHQNNPAFSALRRFIKKQENIII